MTDSQLIQRSALGRNGVLGGFYDARTDKLLDGNMFKYTSKPAVSTFENQNSNYREIAYITSETLLQKFEKLHVEGELQLSFLCGYPLQLNGSARYLTDSNDSKKYVRSSLVYSVQTKYTTLSLSDPNLKEHINFEALHSTKATHIIQKINWGLRAIVTLEAEIDSIENLEKIKTELETCLQCIRSKIEGSYDSPSIRMGQEKSLNIRVDTDVSPYDYSYPQTIDQAIEFINKIQFYLKCYSNGLGKPLVFTLFPLNKVTKKLQKNKPVSIVRRISDDYILKYVFLFDRVNQLQINTFRLLELLKIRRVCISDYYCKIAQDIKLKAINYEHDLQKNLEKEVSNYRSNKNTDLIPIDYNEIEHLEQQYNNLNTLVLKKIRIYKKITKLGGLHIVDDETLEKELDGVSETYVFYFSINFLASNEDLYKQLLFFLQFIENKKESKKIAVDLDFIASQEVKRPTIVHYRGCKIVSKNYYKKNFGNELSCDPDDHYKRKQFNESPEYHYNRTSESGKHYVPDDYYNRKHVNASPHDHYMRGSRSEMYSVSGGDYNEVLPKVQHSIQGDHYDRDSIDKGHRPLGDNYYGSSKIEGHCVPNDYQNRTQFNVPPQDYHYNVGFRPEIYSPKDHSHREQINAYSEDRKNRTSESGRHSSPVDHHNRKQFNASREDDYNRGFRGGMGSIPDDECNRSSIDGRRSARVGKSSYEDHHNRRQSSMPPEDRYNKNSRGGMHSVPKDRYNENYENSHNSPTEDFDNETSTGGLNLIYTENYIPVTKKPSQQIALEICCPRAFENGSCDEINIVWHCRNCGEEVKYGFDNYFYCSCGKGLCQSYKFRCANKNHESYIRFGQTNVLKACLEQKRTTDLNILVLGPTGVGKSTWLNSIINYMTFDTLEEAERSGPRIVVPVCFTVTGEDSTETLVKYEVADGDEDLKVGQSATQHAKTYSFNWNDTKVRIIDTPGMGDVRGIEKDRENLRNILDHISHLDELHAICILLKPNEARLSVFFKFCVKELLANLHKSAIQNIIFCFTNARSTFYKPGDTLPVLSSLLKELAFPVTISKDTIYCLDNESLRFLCTLRYPNITYDKFEKRNFLTSWEKSVNETMRIFNYIKQLKPHKTADTVTLNEARRLVLILTKPMADITKNIELNISAIKDKQDEVARHKMSEKELLQNLYFPIIVFQPKPLGYPRTVCVASKCVEYCQLQGVKSKQILYKQHCHEHCYIKNIAVETHPNVELLECEAMDGNGSCRHCGCSWKKHAYYLRT